MGIDYDAICFYGVYFTHDELKHLKNHCDFKQLIDEIGCDDLDNMWYEMGSNYTTVSPYYDSREEHRLFCLGEILPADERWCRATGVKITSDDLKTWLDEHKNKVEQMVREFCEKYNVEYCEPAFIALPSVS